VRSSAFRTRDHLRERRSNTSVTEHGHGSEHDHVLSTLLAETRGASSAGVLFGERPHHLRRSPSRPLRPTIVNTVGLTMRYHTNVLNSLLAETGGASSAGVLLGERRHHLRRSPSRPLRPTVVNTVRLTTSFSVRYSMNVLNTREWQNLAVPRVLEFCVLNTRECRRARERRSEHEHGIVVLNTSTVLNTYSEHEHGSAEPRDPSRAGVLQSLRYCLP
jgi:hypothetical protein